MRISQPSKRQEASSPRARARSGTEPGEGLLRREWQGDRWGCHEHGDYREKGSDAG